MNTVQTLVIRRTDTLPAVRHALRQVGPGPVLLVMPADGRALLSEPVDLALIKQEATALGQTIGVVTFDRRVKAAARALRVPVFTFESWGRWRMSQTRPWWLPAPSRRSGARTHIAAGDRRAVHTRLTPPPRWLRFVERYTTILLFFALLAVLIVTAVYAAPAATVTLRPVLQPLRVTQTVVADPRYSAATAGGASVPGRLLVSVARQRADVAPTGFKAVPVATARGTVTFVNRLAEPVIIPAGTRVSTSAAERIIFQTVAEATAPGRLGGEVDVEVVAVQPGLSGNLPADQVNRIEGSLAAILNVRNLWPIGGGAVEYRPAVTTADKQRLREHILEALRAQARQNMEAALEPGEFLAADSIRLVAVYLETYSHFVGEDANLLTLEMRAELHGTAVDERVTEELVYAQLYAQAPDGYRILDDSIRTRIGNLLGVDGEGRVILQMIGDAVMAADLAPAPLLDVVTGQQIPIARAYLNEQLPLRSAPEVRVWPATFDRMPYLTARIYTVIDTNP